MADVPACLASDNFSDSLPEDFEAEYGTNDKSRNDVRAARRVVVKVQLIVIPCHTMADHHVDFHAWSQVSCQHHLLHCLRPSTVCGRTAVLRFVMLA